MTMDKEVIVCAAVQLAGGDIILGVRHFDKWMQRDICDCFHAAELKDIDPEDLKDHVQGFMTNKHRFVDRNEAGKIFGINRPLMSEDLY
jgi:hypothetical protein